MAHVHSSHNGVASNDDRNRRDCLFLATGAMGAVGTCAAVWPLISQMQPDAAAIAAGGPIDVDLATLPAGQQSIVSWRNSPIFVVNRTPEALKRLQDPALLARLRDPHSSVTQQPPTDANWHRSIEPRIGVYVGICTHLGCIPKYFPDPSMNEPTSDWAGGWFCPCHGSKYDLAGRVYVGVPAPYNLPVPPYKMLNPHTIRIGEAPPGVKFEMTDVVQM